MLNEERIRQMSDICMYRKNHKKEIEETENYFRVDYITKHMLRGLLGFSVIYFMYMGAILLVNFNTLLDTFDFRKILDFFKPYLFRYVVILLVMEVLILILYDIRYSKRAKILKTYAYKLKRFEKGR